MSVYLVADTWRAVNPWRTLADLLPDLGRPYPEELGAWPAVAGLLGLVLLEVVSPVADVPWLLAVVVLAYTAVTLAGAAVYGSDTWFETVDPVSRVFRWYGRLAPLQRVRAGGPTTLSASAVEEPERPEADGRAPDGGHGRDHRGEGGAGAIALALPGAALVRERAVGRDEVAFLVALLWVTTFDGLVATPTWDGFARALVGAGLPPLAVYVGAMVAGFGLFLGVYRLASLKARDTADTYVSAEFIERWFAPALLPIAAGYHLAHFLGYFLTLAPALVAVVTSPLDPPASVAVLTLPGWFGSLKLLFVVLGHMLAVWVGHTLAFELFTGRLQPIRSQYPFVLVMVFYTSTSMWVVAQPRVPPPFV